VVAKADSKKKKRSLGTEAKAAKQRPALSNQPSIQQLVNRGLSDVTGERAATLHLQQSQILSPTQNPPQERKQENKTRKTLGFQRPIGREFKLSISCTPIFL
jgi:hypothetical protein